ncbi:hypothetical protein SAMN06295967_101174 [Belliella buryatensis]|uniref:Beta-lactamase-inhibitor-like, PepSY-like n=1 Tax=Belliella buryatensis TaxID=1500549 RepID=A0A239AIU2_9BACT|nr:hypothetical protein [Belliella buryatensis]SNR95291.1 hypothetical protein SAMN06295967_101174 [Belliella buryatensis]
MKTQIMIAAMLFYGAATIPFQSESKDLAVIETIIDLQEKEKIEASALPDPVKKSIADDATISELPILEVWKVKSEEGEKYFKIKFGNGGEGLTKKYDAEGVEIK